MSVLFKDNFSNYGSGSGGVTTSLDGIYAESFGGATFAADPDGVSSGLVLKLETSGFTPMLRKVIAQGNQTTLGVMCRLWFDELPGSVAQFLTLRDTANANQITFTCNSTGTISAYRGDTGGTLLGTTSAPVITAHGWFHFEVKVFFSQTVGTIEVKINEATVLDLSAIDTCNTSNVGCAQMLLNGNSSATLYIKDYMYWNELGTVNNDFMGDYQVVTSAPAGDVSLNWTPSTGSTGYDLINEADPDDANYIYADVTPPAAAVFSLEDLATDVVQIASVQTMVRAMKTDSGSAHIQVSMVSDGSDSDGADTTVTVAETYYPDIHELDPDTGLAWTRISFNAANLKINRLV